MITREYSTIELLELGNILKQEIRVCHSLASEAVIQGPGRIGAGAVDTGKQ